MTSKNDIKDARINFTDKHDDCCGCHKNHHHDNHSVDSNDHNVFHHEHHKHHHEETQEGFIVFESHTHEGATVCSFEKECSLTETAACEAIIQLISRLTAWIEQQDALIGHIKSYVKSYSSQTFFSTTGSKIHVEKLPGNGARIGFAAIILGIDTDQLSHHIRKLALEIK